MRELKFRAWNKVEKRMEKVIGITWKDGEIHQVSTQEQYERHGQLVYYTPYFTKNFLKIIQYTGLKDINNKEIYEGDILKDTNNAIYYVDFIRGCFYLKTNYKSFPHLGWTEWLPMCEIDRLAIPVEFEIIGNIYENPELLEG